MAEPLLDEMAKLVLAYLGERVKRQNIINQAGANTVYISAHEVAKAIGLSERVRNNLTPFPSTNVSIIESPPASAAETETPPAKGDDPPPKTTAPVEQAPKVDPPTKQRGLLRRLAPWLIAAAIGGASTGGYFIEQHFRNGPEQRDGEVGVKIE